MLQLHFQIKLSLKYIIYKFFINHKNPNPSNKTNTNKKNLSYNSKNNKQQTTKSKNNKTLNKNTSQTNINNNNTSQNSQTTTTNPNQTKKIITIPITKKQITPKIIKKNNKINSLTNFKILISLNISNKIQQKTNINLTHQTYNKNLSLKYPSSTKIIKIFTNNTFTNKTLSTLSSYIIFTLIQ